MIGYEKKILDILLDKYEKSKSFVGANQVNQSFTCKIAQLFPEYSDDSEYELFRNLNECVAQLESRGFVKVQKKKNGVLQSVTLVLSALSETYRYIGRTPKSDTVGELRRLLEDYSKSGGFLADYCRIQLERIASNKAVEYFDGDTVSYELLLKAASAVTEVKNEMFERDFSVQYLGDSKAFEKIRSRVVSLLYEYGDFPEKETLLADLNIVKNPGHVYFKGKGVITVCGQKIDFSAMNGDLAISSEILKNVDCIEVTGSTVITIENLTAFNAFRCEDSFAIYLGGYHNSVRRNFIQKVYGQNQEKKYLHFGDIDAGGFYILQHLRNKTGIPFETYRMDTQTLKSNLQYAKKLTENDRKRLETLSDTEFGETIEFMLRNGCKLEQEALDLVGIGL